MPAYLSNEFMKMNTFLLQFELKDVSTYTILLAIHKMCVCQAMRLFVGDPVWTPFNRPHDHLPARFDFVGLLIVALYLYFETCLETNHSMTFIKLIQEGVSRILWAEGSCK